ncbi:MAG TPA: RodZ domain-containing protein [Thermoanaerobaculia bacterium]|nr:RodZ domain-containing protein [Thermoanaerobaculia bacterium]
MPGTESAREFGEELRRERELREVSREQLAAATKVSLRHLDALENGRFEQLPAAVFSKGFVRVIALHLGLDAERSTAAFRHIYARWEEEKAKAVSGETSTARLRLSQPRRAVSSSTTVRALGIAILLAAITGGAAFLRTRGGARRAAQGSSPVTRAESGPASLALPPAVAAATVALPVDGPAAAAASARSGRTLTLSFKDECWAEVLVDGKVVVRGLFPKGAKREFAGGGTFTLTLGNAGVVEVAVDGRSLDPIGGEGEVVKNYVIGRG